MLQTTNTKNDVNLQRQYKKRLRFGCSYDGMTMNTDLFVELPCDDKEFLKPQTERQRIFYDYKSLKDYMRLEMKNVPLEQVYVMLLDENNGRLEWVFVGGGGIKVSDFDFARLVKRCNESSAQKAVVAHNHPKGKLVSTEDFIVTDLIRNVLDGVKVELLEHFMISGTVVEGIVHTEKAYRAGFESLCRQKID